MEDSDAWKLAVVKSCNRSFSMPLTREETGSKTFMVSRSLSMVVGRKQGQSICETYYPSTFPRHQGVECRVDDIEASSRDRHKILTKHQQNDLIERDGGNCRCRPFCVQLTSTTVSAGLYLSDFLTNVLVLKEYYEMYQVAKIKNVHTNNDITPFAASLSLMLASHTINLVAFKLKLAPQDNPIRSAYFLPLLQLRRFLAGVWKMGTCGSFERWESDKTEAFYAIMSSAMETAPQLALQFDVFVYIGYFAQSWQPKPVFVASLIAALFSGGYNTGRAIMYEANMKWTLALNWLGLTGGLYTVGELLLRCTTLACVHLADASHMFTAYYFILGVLPASYINSVISLGHTERICTFYGQIRVLVACWVTICLGPPYTVLEGYVSEQDKSKWFKLYLLPFTVILNMLVDVITLCILEIRELSPCNFRKELLRPNQRFLSSTMKCHQFKTFVGVGVGLTILSLALMVYVLAVASSDHSLAVEVFDDERPINPRVHDQKVEAPLSPEILLNHGIDLPDQRSLDG